MAAKTLMMQFTAAIKPPRIGTSSDESSMLMVRLAGIGCTVKITLTLV